MFLQVATQITDLTWTTGNVIAVCAVLINIAIIVGGYLLQAQKTNSKIAAIANKAETDVKNVREAMLTQISILKVDSDREINERGARIAKLEASIANNSNLENRIANVEKTLESTQHIIEMHQATNLRSAEKLTDSVNDLKVLVAMLAERSGVNRSEILKATKGLVIPENS